MSKGTRPRPSVISQEEIAAKHTAIFGTQKSPRATNAVHTLCRHHWQF